MTGPPHDGLVSLHWPGAQSASVLQVAAGTHWPKKLPLMFWQLQA
jgi:hypothetical protein